jgi:Fur family iron response transcriptional regulator
MLICEPPGLIPPSDPKSRPLTSCHEFLRRAGLRPTRQRVMLARILLAGGNRHITAETLYEEASASEVLVSRATIYNTLRQFTQAGLLRQIGVDGARSFFDTNPTAHHHFFVEDDETLFDIPQSGLLLDRVPQAPEGFEVVRFDVVVRLRRKDTGPA